MTAFAEELLDGQGHRWKLRAVETNSGIVRKDILPAFGDRTVGIIIAKAMIRR